MRWRQGTGWPWVIYAMSPAMATYAQNYTITVDNASVSAEIPVEKAPSNPTGLPYTDVACRQLVL